MVRGEWEYSHRIKYGRFGLNNQYFEKISFFSINTVNCKQVYSDEVNL